MHSHDVVSETGFSMIFMRYPWIFVRDGIFEQIINYKKKHCKHFHRCVWKSRFLDFINDSTHKIGENVFANFFRDGRCQPGRCAVHWLGVPVCSFGSVSDSVGILEILEDDDPLPAPNHASCTNKTPHWFVSGHPSSISKLP